MQQDVVSSVHRSLAANVSGLARSQNVKTEKMIKQPEVWLDEVRKSILQCRDERQYATLITCVCHNTSAKLTATHLVHYGSTEAAQ